MEGTHKTMTYGSFCSGIEAPSVAWHPLGWRPQFFSEIEKFPCCVLAHHYPTVPNLGDMMSIDGATLPQCDVWIAGTPCQSFSVAGLRKGLTDERGNLTMQFVRIIRDAESAGVGPRFVVWENVPGVLSDKGNAFGCFLAGLIGASQPLVPTTRSGKWTGAGHVSGPEGTAAWRILDAQYFGVAQRRRRVFVIRCPRDGCDPAKILFEFDGLRRDFAPRRTKGEGIARSTNDRTASGSRPVMGTLTARMCTSLGPRDVEEGAAIVVPIDMRQASRGEKMTNNRREGSSGGAPGTGIGEAGDPSPTISVSHPPAVAYRTSANCGVMLQGERTGTLNTNTDRTSQIIQGAFGVRRLMPVECERLQSFPDDYTNIPGAKDGPRYKAIGNSMAAVVIRWLGKRIQQFA